MRRNYVAKNMNQFNRASVVPNKRNKMLDDLWERENDEVVDFYVSTGDACDSGIPVVLLDRGTDEDPV